jgi:hypothetical protein
MRHRRGTTEIFSGILAWVRYKSQKNIKYLAENAKSEMVKLNALTLAAKCLRLTQEPEQTHQGVNIIINTVSVVTSGSQCAPQRPKTTIQGEPLSPKTLQITQ